MEKPWRNLRLYLLNCAAICRALLYCSCETCPELIRCWIMSLGELRLSGTFSPACRSICAGFCWSCWSICIGFMRGTLPPFIIVHHRNIASHHSISSFLAFVADLLKVSSSMRCLSVSISSCIAVKSVFSA